MHSAVCTTGLVADELKEAPRCIRFGNLAGLALCASFWQTPVFLGRRPEKGYSEPWRQG